mgnify:CR=1 FL=1
MKRLVALFFGALLGLGARGQTAEATLETQLRADKPGAILTVTPTQVLFMPPKVPFSAWQNTPIWADGARPKPSAQGTPKGWKGLTAAFHDAFGRAQATVNIPAGTDLYGTGEVLGPLRRNGQTITLWNQDNYGYQSYDPTRLYQSHPWVLGLRPDGSAFGVLADSTYRGSITLTETQIRFDFEGPVYPLLIIEGSDPADVLRQLADRTGHMPLPPLWALGYQQSRFGYKSAADCLRIAQTFRNKRIPCDVMWMDIDYMDGYRVFTFNPKTFPNPKAYMAELHRLNLKGIWMIDPGVKTDPAYAVYQQGQDGNHWVKTADTQTDFIGRVWPGNCKFPDFTRAETRAWWSRLTASFVTQNDIDGLWNDMNEPAVFDGTAHTMPPDNFHRGDGALFTPGPHVRYHNIYGMQMIRASRQGLLNARPNCRPFILTRANFLGGQRYGATWTGDNLSSPAHLRLSIPMTLTLGLSGQPFNGPDLGGFGNSCTPQLMRQWVGFGAFFPFCRNHACKGTKAQEPWALGKETETVFRTALERRYALLPYLYTLFREAAETGAPILRPLFFADPKDPALRREEQAFLLGGDVLVLPAFATHPARPKGNWAPVSLLNSPAEHHPDQAALLLRPGAILPVIKPAQSTEEADFSDLTLLANPNENGMAEGLLYEDAGDGFGYQTGNYCLTRLHLENKNGSPTLTATHIEGARSSAVKNTTLKLLSNPPEKQTENKNKRS